MPKPIDVPKPERPKERTNSRGSFYERGTPEEEEAKHLDRIKGAKDRKDKKTGKHNAG